MKINIYYGGRGLIDDPTLYIINKMEEVLQELHITLEKFPLFEQKSSITSLPQTLKDADGIILATTIEWYGIGGFMQQFLDACWLYGDKEKISQLYMCPVVMATTYGEREGKLNLETAWEILGGQPCTGICGYITDLATLEMNEDYSRLAEKTAENFYRTINQKLPCFPTSNQAVKQKISITQNVNLTPQETEQLSQYASDDRYVQKTKEDIKELASLFRNMMGETTEENQYAEILEHFKSNFTPVPGFRGNYKIVLDNKQPVFIEIDQDLLHCSLEGAEKADVEIQMSRENMNDIFGGKMVFQNAFMSGVIKMKGDFQALRGLDQVFHFK